MEYVVNDRLQGHSLVLRFKHSQGCGCTGAIIQQTLATSIQHCTR